MKVRIIFPFLFFLIMLNLVSGSNNVVLKLIPEEIETNGSLVMINITVENIPPKDSLKHGDKKDGGLGGLDIYVNYSPEYLDAVEFKWSDTCKNEDMKSYEFKNGEFFLTILFSEDITDSKITVGTLIFNPKKIGETEVNIENKSIVSSIQGHHYDGTDLYPNTIFKGCRVIIKGVGEENVTKHLKEEYKGDSGGANKIINKVTVITNQTAPKIIVKEINISQIEPNISLNLKVDYNGIDIKLFSLIFIVSAIGGIIFGHFNK